MNTIGMNADELARIYNNYGVRTFAAGAKPDGFVVLEAEESTRVVIAVPEENREALQATLRLINA